MRDLPPVIHSAEKSQKQDHHEMEEALTAANGRLPGYPGTPPSSCPVSCPPASSPTVPPRPNHTGRDSSQILPLKRQLVSQVSLDSPLSPALRPHSPWGLLDPYDSPEDQDKEYVGFATLPNQVHRKTVKKGFTFTLMVAGETGLGKSTLINSLFLTDLYKDRKVPNAEESLTLVALHISAERISQTVDIIKHTIGIEEKGVKLRLSIIDTPGFGDAVNNTASWKHVEDYIDQQFEQYFRDESGLNRKNIQDNRVHCLLYFISPFGHGEEIKQFGINIYQFPECDSDEDEDFQRQEQILKDSIPFAVIGSNIQVESKGRKFRGRSYPWGVVEGSEGRDAGESLRKLQGTVHPEHDPHDGAGEETQVGGARIDTWPEKFTQQTNKGSWMDGLHVLTCVSGIVYAKSIEKGARWTFLCRSQQLTQTWRDRFLRKMKKCVSPSLSYSFVPLNSEVQ
ncbi:hypothetical protein XENOCAPTIV_021328 [Xenoophorus captivus]|uniref:Septin-type G domain-containing protein n=1 Tax=Xenoophorus captivus TaxID=1517983 RepID=A0ABV0QW71_9TELE